MRHKLQLINPKTTRHKSCECCGRELTQSRICLEDPSKRRYVCISCVVDAYSSLAKETLWQRIWKRIAFWDNNRSEDAA